MKLSNKPIHQQAARSNLGLFAALVFALLSLLLICSAQFARQISDPIYVMWRGFKENDYFLEVKIRENMDDDDVFMLAKEYNELWLPLKAKMNKVIENKKTKLSMDSIFTPPDIKKD